MSLSFPTIPDDPQAIATWLEKMLMSEQFPEFVGELAAIHQRNLSEPISLEGLLPTDSLRQILEQGLSALPRTQLRQLLQSPQSLWQLQEIVLTNGGEFWDRVSNTDSLTSIRSTLWTKLESSLKLRPNLQLRPTDNQMSNLVKPWFARPWPWVINIASVAAVAGVIVAIRPTPEKVIVENPKVEGKQTQGVSNDALLWTDTERLSKITDPAEYMQTLAKVGDWWKDHPATTRLEFAARFGELRRGCSMLINSPHRSLSDKERQQLIEKCREWASQMSEIQNEIEDPSSNHQVSQSQADSLVRRMANRLKDGFKS